MNEVDKHILLPGPDGPGQHGPHTASGSDRSRGRRAGGAIPTTEEIYQLLMRLNGLVALGLVAPARANVIQRGLKTILDGLSRERREAGHVEAQQGLAELCRRNPEMLRMLEPFLTDEQIAWVLEGTPQDHAEEDVGQ